MSILSVWNGGQDESLLCAVDVSGQSLVCSNLLGEMVTHVNKIHESIQPNVNESVDDNCYLDIGFSMKFSQNKSLKLLKD